MVFPRYRILRRIRGYLCIILPRKCGDECTGAGIFCRKQFLYYGRQPDGTKMVSGRGDSKGCDRTMQRIKRLEASDSSQARGMDTQAMLPCLRWWQN